MSDNTPNPSGDSTQTSGQSGNQNTQQDSVKNPEAVLAQNKELLAELKKEREARKAIQEKLDADEAEKLLKDGKKDEYITGLKQKLEAAEKARKEDSEKFGKNTLTSQMDSMARAMGCEKPELVRKLVDMNTVDVDGDFQVNKDQLKAALAKVKEEVPALFKKQQDPPNDINPQGSSQVNVKTDLSKLSKQDLKGALRKLPSS